MTSRESDTIANLKKFRDLSFDQKEHSAMLKEKKVILYAATLLESNNVRILELCLEILENFVANEEAHSFLLSTFGIYEALETLAVRIRNKNEKISHRANELTEILRNCAPPAYNTRSRLKGNNKPVKRHHLFLLYIEDLDTENQEKLEHVLVKIRGIISFLVDMEMKRCTVRICPKITIKEVIEKIYQKSSLRAKVITKNTQERTEAYYDVLEKSIDRTYLEYPEEEYSPRRKAVTTAAINLAKNSSHLLKSVVNFWNESFYW